MTGATLDEQVSAVADLLETEQLAPAPAVVLLQNATGLCPRLAGELLKREFRRRRQQAVSDVAASVRGAVCAPRATDGTWSQ